MSEPVVKVSNFAIHLHSVNEATDDEQLESLKLFAMLVGAPISKIEDAKKPCDSVGKVHYILTEHFTEIKAKQLLLAMLKEIGVHRDTLECLAGSIEEAWKSWEKDFDFAFGKLIISLCKMVDDEQFDALKGLLRKHLGKLHPNKVYSKVRMFAIVIRKFKASKRNELLRYLTSAFETMQLKDCVDEIHKFENLWMKATVVQKVSQNGRSSGQSDSIKEQEETFSTPPETPPSAGGSLDNHSLFADGVARESCQESKMDPQKDEFSVKFKPNRTQVPKGSVMVGENGCINASPSVNGSRVGTTLTIPASFTPPREGQTVNFKAFNETSTNSASPDSSYLYMHSTPFQETVQHDDQRHDESTLTSSLPSSPRPVSSTVDSDGPMTSSGDDIMMNEFPSCDDHSLATSPVGKQEHTTPKQPAATGDDRCSTKLTTDDVHVTTTQSLSDGQPKTFIEDLSGPIASTEDNGQTNGDYRLTMASGSSETSGDRQTTNSSELSSQTQDLLVGGTTDTLQRTAGDQSQDRVTRQSTTSSLESAWVQFKKKTKSIPYSWQCLLPTSIIFIFFIIFLIAFVIILLKCRPQPIKYPPAETLGVAGDLVAVGEVDGNCVSNVTLSEVLHRNDYSHVNSIFMAPSSKLKVRQNTTKYTSANHTQHYPSRSTGLVDYVYLLNGSVINYHICLARLVSRSSETGYGHMYIFDNFTNYENFIIGESGVESKAVHNVALTIDGDGDTRCVDLTYNVTRTAYYFITGKTPDNIYYHFNYTFKVNYLDRLDYEHRCDVYIPKQCVIYTGIPEENVLVMAYVTPPVAADPFTTHIKMTIGESSCKQDSCHGSQVAAYVCLSFSFFCLVSFVVIVVTYYYWRWRRHCHYNSQGYEPISDD